MRNPEICDRSNGLAPASASGFKAIGTNTSVNFQLTLVCIRDFISVRTFLIQALPQAVGPETSLLEASACVPLQEFLQMKVRLIELDYFLIYLFYINCTLPEDPPFCGLIRFAGNLVAGDGEQGSSSLKALNRNNYIEYFPKILVFHAKH